MRKYSLVLFCCCWACSVFSQSLILPKVGPPAPVEIKTPHSASLHLPDENHIVLVFDFDTSKTVYYTIKTTDDSIKSTTSLIQSKIEEIIVTAQSRAKELHRSLVVIVTGDNNAKYPDFKVIIDALRSKDIYNYQLITKPDEH